MAAFEVSPEDPLRSFVVPTIGRPMFVAFAKEFARHPRTAELIDVRTQQAVNLGACLMKAQL